MDAYCCPVCGKRCVVPSLAAEHCGNPEPVPPANLWGA